MMSREEVNAWHNDHENFANMPIDLNGPDISDVIVRQKSYHMAGSYKNWMTGKESYFLKDVIRNRRFVVINNDEAIINLSLSGFYVFENKELDFLAIVLAEIKLNSEAPAKWVETERFFLSRDYDCFNEYLHIGCNAFDICGQSVITADQKDYAIECVGAKEAAISYFEGFVTFFDACCPYFEFIETFGDKSSFETVFNIFSKDGFNEEDGTYYDIVYGEITEIDDDVYFKDMNEIQTFVDGLSPLPNEAMKKLKDYAKKYALAEGCRLGNMGLITRESNIEMCCLQRVNDMIYERCYKPVMYCSYPFKNSKVELIEYKRVMISKGFFNGDEREFSKCMPIWCDDMTGTLLEHSSSIIREYIQILDDTVSKTIATYLDGIKKFDEAVDEANSKFQIKYSIFHRDVVFAAMCIGANEIIEKIYNINCEHKNELRGYLLQKILYDSLHRYDLGTVLEKMFGRLDSSQDKLNKILMLPRGMFEMIVDFDINKTNIGELYTDDDAMYKRMECLRSIKTMFNQTEDTSKYLFRVNKDDFEKLLIWLTTSPITWSLQKPVEIVKLLISLFGVENWKNYLAHAALVAVKNEEDKYSDYLERLCSVKSIGEDTVKNAEWKLFGQDLQKAYDSLEDAYYMAIDKSKYAAACEEYKKRAKIWSSFEFSDDEYMITYPKTPSDIIREGTELKHCVKEFINDVANGSTSILFIRKRNKPKKPFYTLEIRGGKIRQCHGNSNKNVREEDGSLENFLMKFCEEKRIIYSSGEALLGI